MIVFRIAREEYIRDLSGYGAYLYGGRWSQKGTFALYTSAYQSLAYLEYLVHQHERPLWPDDLCISEIEIKDRAPIIDYPIKDLPSKWKEAAYTAENQNLITSLFQNSCFGVKLPSAILPSEFNVVLNPKHEDFHSLVKIKDVQPVDLDKRFQP